MWIVSLILVLASVFFVAAEYSMVSARKNRLEALGRKGNKRAKRLARELENVSAYVAGSQVGITMVGIGVGSITEPFVTELLSGIFSHNQTLSHLLGPKATQTLGYALSFFLVALVLVVIGELVPKYFALRRAEAVAMTLFVPMKIVSTILSPVIWLAQSLAALILRIVKIDIHESAQESVPKEELLMLIQSGGDEGVLDKTHADMVTRALRIDVLDARDIMIHRLDIKWLDIDLTLEPLKQRLREIPFTRLPVCRGDIDDMVGLVYLHDIVKHWDEPGFCLERVVRPVVVVPENLPMERIVETMRSEKTQMLIVMDEYGGTSGLVTLEDVVEEVFGELEDRLESERPLIEELPGHRVSARADVRFDELVSRLRLPIEPGENTDTLATMVVDALERVPRPGDSVETVLGLMRVENMARRRITRVSIHLDEKLTAKPSDEG